MKQYLLTTIILLASIPASASAVYQAYWPTNHALINTNTSSPVLVEYTDGRERMVMQPQFKGTMESITFITIVPRLPEVRMISSDLFLELGALTGNEQSVPSAFEKDYTIQIIPLVSASSITQILDGQGHAYTQDDRDTFAQLAKQKGYAVVVSLEMGENTLFDDEGYYGTLSPIEISFDVPSPVLPLQFMNSANPVTIDLFVIADESYLVPGATTYRNSRQVPYTLEAPVINCITTPCPSSWIHDYNLVTGNRWVTAQELVLDTQAISNDLYLTKMDQDYVVAPFGSPRVLRSDLYRESMGIMKGTAPEWGTVVPEYPTLLGGTRLLMRGTQGQDVKELQEVLNSLLSLTLVADGIWGAKTHEAVAQFQTQYQLKIDGVVGNQTRSFLRSVLFGNE